MDWEGWQDSIGLPLAQHVAAERIDFDGDDWPMAEEDSSEDSPARSGEQVAFGRAIIGLHRVDIGFA